MIHLRPGTFMAPVIRRSRGLAVHGAIGTAPPLLIAPEYPSSVTRTRMRDTRL
jgi:hypothetical protein